MKNTNKPDTEWHAALVRIADDLKSEVEELHRFIEHLRTLAEPPEGIMLDTRIVNLRLNSERLKWLHTGSGRDEDGCEWGVFRVKWNAQGQPIEVWQTCSDYSDLDREMRREASLENQETKSP